MKKLALILILAAAPAWSTPPDNRPPDNRPPDHGAHPGGDASAEASASNISETTVTTSANIETGAVTINQNREAQGDYTVKFRNNPNVYTNAPAPTISCYKTGGGGASGGGIGLSFGGGKIDPYCVKREEIRIGFAIGMIVQARFAWCNLENNLELFSSVSECLSADTSKVSPEYHLLLQEKERIERELRKVRELVISRCAAAEERGDRLEESWLECLAK